ncbi:sugar ABC transporter ATP-binding protein [Ornithinimicrobium pratense]|uniref:Sugar ABC transporter ATP-binding protein n=1 Tax=Ornithinimicrobium pratense TaxID=2593973 RepID=A0A5J6V8R6_9MICO|nr:sugar ABC transporter ATP-binding protein [Ornithinimicrobium pratense]QFG69744.1 sugar ABC transporter ATP-binding protein [Ornithinimicrobium pratense]
MTTTGSTPVLELVDVSKSFGANRALRSLNLSIDSGEVHGLLGKNGAGKSTLIKVVAGIYEPDQGSVRVRGVKSRLGSPSGARELGVAVVNQELSLVPTMTVAENFQLGRWSSTAGFLNRKASRAATVRALERVRLQRRPEEPLTNLGMAERQLLEIAKALDGEISVLLLDEPTSSLSDAETRRLFELVRELKANGTSVIYVSHRMSEILELTDRVTILRDGQADPPVETAGTDEKTLARMMVGDVRQVERTAQGAARGQALLEVTGLRVDERLKGIDLQIGAGEVVTVYGLMGAGRTRLARALFGLETWTGGSASIEGKPFAPTKPLDAINAKIGFVGEDRSAGLVPKMSVVDNITLGSLGLFSSYGHYNRKAATAKAKEFVQRLAIKTESVDTPVGQLSGGNQQKVLLARWLLRGAHVLILDDPARGVDVGAREEIFAELAELSASGAGVLYLTSDAEEAQRLGDRILVMANGRIVADLPASADEDTIVAAAGGAHV